MINLIVKRFDPSTESSPYTDVFRINVALENKWTVMDLLNYVQQHIDSSVRYHQHSVCNRGICRRCLAKINGRVQRLCEHVVTNETDVLLEPANDKSVIIDLVTN